TWPLADRTVFVADVGGGGGGGRGPRRRRGAGPRGPRGRGGVCGTSFGPNEQTGSISQSAGVVQPSGWGDELWVLLLTIAAVLVIVEWFTYHRRVSV
ncbi:MAG: hypothetical protein VX398_07805, partial [Acidobacteriota bacterium]|nr:hypothetical protein [Acidobacteriota bacterium]